MNEDLATHISLLAAPIYAALIQRVLSDDGVHVPAVILESMRKQAITQALALWADILSYKA